MSNGIDEMILIRNEESLCAKVRVAAMRVAAECVCPDYCGIGMNVSQYPDGRYWHHTKDGDLLQCPAEQIYARCPEARFR